MRFSLTFSRALIGISALCALTTGCGNGLGQVSGTITLDGQPLVCRDGVMATVMFQPASGSGVSAVGHLDAEGRYQVMSGSQAGLAPGEYAVTCAVNQVIPSTTGGDASGKALSDPRFANGQTSGLRFTVQPGANEFNLAIESPKTSSRPRGR